MGNTRYGENRRVHLQAELFYFFIDFFDLQLDEFNLCNEMIDLNFFCGRRNPDRTLCGFLQKLGCKRNLASPLFLKEWLNFRKFSVCNFISASEGFQKLHINRTVLAFEQMIVFGKDHINTLLESVGVDIQFFFQVMMVACQLSLLVKLKTIKLCDTIRFFTSGGRNDIADGKGIQIIVFGDTSLHFAGHICCYRVDESHCKMLLQ